MAPSAGRHLSWRLDATGLSMYVYRDCNCSKQAASNQTDSPASAKQNKEAPLAQLTSFEKMAKDLDRARSLRRLMDEIAASPAAQASWSVA